MDISTLDAQIELAFPGEPLPEMSLCQAVLADSSLTKIISKSDWEAERRRDGHISWRDISDKVLMECQLGMAQLDEALFVYYLGAFLRFLVRHVDADLSQPEGSLTCAMVFSITDRSNHSLARFKKLSDQQIDCVIEALRLVKEKSASDADDAAKALTRYWLTPDARRKTIIHLP